MVTHETDSLTIDFKEIPLITEQLKFGWAIELLKHKRYCLLLNELLQNVNSSVRLDFSIIDLAITFMLNGKQMNESETKTFFKLKRKIHQLFYSMEPISKFGSYVDFDVDLFLLTGFDVDVYEPDKNQQLEYEIILNNYIMNNMSYKEFLKASKNIIE